MSDTYFRVCESIPPHKPVTLRTFLAKITRNLSLDRFKMYSAEKRGGNQVTLVLDELKEGLHIYTGDDRKTIDIIAPFVYDMPTMEKLGDYPIITEDTALEMLMNGDYMTTVPDTELKDGMIQSEDVHKSELIYLTGSGNEYFIPYYKFYVELPFEAELIEENGWDPSLLHYGIYYVPAVEGEYISEYTPSVNGIWTAR